MSQVVLHLGKEYIEEDLEYYFSGERDKNNQVRPDDTIYSMTPFESHIDIDLNDGKVGNFFYPLTPNLLDRIYIGISISLFANHWGASFLLELLKQVKPGGAIILPVYPEGQAAEKNYWSRSFLENIFLSRTRWRGMSNINAENDGVMSLREGRKWPEPLPSSIEWFYQQRSNLLLKNLMVNNDRSDTRSFLQKTFAQLCQIVWQEYTTSAVTERIIIDHFGAKTPVTINQVGSEYGLLVNDLMLSRYVNVQDGKSWHVGECSQVVMESVSQFFAPLTMHRIEEIQNLTNLSINSAEICVLNNVLLAANDTDYQELLQQVWASIPANGLLVVYENLSANQAAINTLDTMLSGLAEINYYSSIAACKIKPNYEISQYSLAVEENLRQEHKHKANVFRVLKKPA